MTRSGWPSLGFAFVLALCTAGARAQDTRMEDLERSLQERDKVINELLQRIEVLERRVGVPRPAAAAPAATPAEKAGRPPGTVVVEEGAAERALERSLTREGALLLPPGALEVEPSFTYSRREEDTPSFVPSGGGVLAARTGRNTDTLTADLALRLGLPWSSQLELGLPYRRRKVEFATSVGFTPTDVSSQSAGGAGDLRVGLATTLLREGLWRPDLIGRVTWDTDTGKTQDNAVSLGGGFHELRGSFTAIKRQDPMAFVGGLAYQHAFEKDHLQPGRTLSASFDGFVALSPETSLHLALSGAYQKETELFGRKIGGSDQTVATFIVGGSTLLGRGILLNLSAAIGLTNDADDFSLTASLPIRFDGMSR